ncbi:unnamed protein product [Fraxinus pennsylvanica]|uniref:Uncharacterized protein n=1 Tax=Fraxinus pennsylvanica TaxID=56036 RepID=A0AAD2A1S8_9LAMI|nr:unnamed protein product [Fraxinus pennsylvanica]
MAVLGEPITSTTIPLLNVLAFRKRSIIITLQIISNGRLSANLSPDSFDAVGLGNACINETGYHAGNQFANIICFFNIPNLEAIIVAEQENFLCDASLEF